VRFNHSGCKGSLWMPQQSLDSFWVTPKEIQQQPKPVLQQAPKATVDAKSEPKKSEYKRPVFPPLAPANLPPSYFVSASYDGKQKKAVIKLYEPESGEIFFWYDNTGHLPYLLTNLSVHELGKLDRVMQHEGFHHFETEEKLDSLMDKKVIVTKVVCKDPLAIGGRPGGTIRDIIPDDFPKVAESYVDSTEIKVWESKIKYYQTYIYDRKLLPGMIYEIKDGNLVETVVEQAAENLNKIRDIFKDCTVEEQEFVEMWAKLLEYPAPNCLLCLQF